MTRDDIVRMARECGWGKAGRGMEYPVLIGRLERFAALVAAAEREACAEILFNYAERDDLSDSDQSLLKHLFELIRARGEK